MSTYSTNLRLELIGTGEQQGTWGSTTNTNLGTLLEQAITGYSAISVTDGADTTLTTANGASDQARNMTLVLTGTLTAARNVICPATPKIYIVKNSTTGGFAVTFKVSGQTGVSIPNGATYLLFVDGTDVRQATGSIQSGGTGASTAAAAIQALDTWQLVTSAAGTTTLTNTSPRNILVTGSTTQTIVLPDVSTLAVGWTFNIINTSSGTITVQSSGLNSFSTQTSDINASYTCISTSGTTTASWKQNYTGGTSYTGSGGNLVYSFAPAMQRIRFVNANAFTAGTNAQGQGALSETVNIITTAASNPSGVTLPSPSSTATYTTWVTIINKGANPVNVYPASGHTIDALGVNNPISLAVDGVMSFWATSTNQWYSSVNTIDNVSLATGTLAVANGGTGVTTSTGTGSVVLSASPALTGTPTAPTAAAGTNTTQVATTAFVTAATTGRLIRAPQILTAGSTYTTPAGCTGIYVEAVGGGGGGGAVTTSATTASGAGGGSGAYCAKYFTVTPSTAYSYTIGSGGTGVASGAGNAGGNTTFTVGGVTITAGGGSGGGMGGDTGGDGGTASGGDINANGTYGPSSNGDGVGVGGANSFFGGGGLKSSNANGNAGSLGGGGGAASIGGFAGTRTGGTGGSGVIRIWEYA